MNIQDAKNYLKYGVKEGYWEAEEFKDMTDKEIIDFANYQDAKANAEYLEKMLEVKNETK